MQHRGSWNTARGCGGYYYPGGMAQGREEGEKMRREDHAFAGDGALYLCNLSINQPISLSPSVYLSVCLSLFLSLLSLSLFPSICLSFSFLLSIPLSLSIICRTGIVALRLEVDDAGPRRHHVGGCYTTHDRPMPVKLGKERRVRESG